MWSLTLRLREAGMTTLCCRVATAQPPSHGCAAVGGGGGGVFCVCPGEFMASCDSSSKRWIYKVASYSISRSCFYIEKCLCHKQLMDDGGIVYEPCLPLLFYLFYLCCVFYWRELALFQWLTGAVATAHSVLLLFVSLARAGSSSSSSWSVTRTAWRMQGTLETWGVFRWYITVWMPSSVFIVDRSNTSVCFFFFFFLLRLHTQPQQNLLPFKE